MVVHAGHPEHRALAALAQLIAKSAVATQLIIARHPAVGHLITPRVEHLHTLLLSRVITHLRWHVACLASFLVPCPLRGEGQAEVEQGMVAARNISHEDAHLAIVDLPPVATPLALDPDRVRATFGEAARIERDDAIGFAQPSGHLADSHGHQGPMIPGHRADEVLDDLALDLDERRDVLGMLPGQVGQQSLEGAVHVVLAGLGLQNVLIGHDERHQTIHHLMEDVRGDDTISSTWKI